MAAGEQDRILVIKHGALGDIVLATGPFKAIRAHHAGAHIVLLTTTPYVNALKTSGWFDEIWIDDRPKPWNVGEWRRLRRMFREAGFARVYDLQHTDRTALYYRMMGQPRPQWSGIARGASHPHTNPQRDSMHTIERQAEQLAVAGIAETPPSDISWMTADISRLLVTEPFALLVPGGARHRPKKRWPASRYAALANWFRGRGLQPVLIGALQEGAIMEEIEERTRGTLNLCNDTSFGAIAELGRRATVAVGNDTGPMHLIAAAGCPSVVLFSDTSVPEQTAPRGETVIVVQQAKLPSLGVGAVLSAVYQAVPGLRSSAKGDDAVAMESDSVPSQTGDG